MHWQTEDPENLEVSDSKLTEMKDAITIGKTLLTPLVPSHWLQEKNVVRKGMGSLACRNEEVVLLRNSSEEREQRETGC